MCPALITRNYLWQHWGNINALGGGSCKQDIEEGLGLCVQSSTIFKVRFYMKGGSQYGDQRILCAK